MSAIKFFICTLTVIYTLTEAQCMLGQPDHTVFMLIECKLKIFPVTSGEGCHSLHYVKSQNANFLTLIKSCILLA